MSFNYIISEERNRGKTTAALKLVEKGIIKKGIISLSNSDKSEYYACNIETGEKRILLKEGDCNNIILPRFYIDNASFDWANKYLSSIENGVVLIDEIGRLELNNAGFSSALISLLKKDVTLYLTVRTSFLPEVVEMFKIKDYKVLRGNSL